MKAIESICYGKLIIDTNVSKSSINQIFFTILTQIKLK